MRQSALVRAMHGAYGSLLCTLYQNRKHLHITLGEKVWTVAA